MVVGQTVAGRPLVGGRVAAAHVVVGVRVLVLAELAEEELVEALVVVAEPARVAAGEGRG